MGQGALDEVEGYNSIMNSKRKMLIGLSILGLLVVGFIILAASNGSRDKNAEAVTNNTEQKATLNLTLNGPEKTINVASKTDGYLGTFTIGSVDLRLSKKPHVLTLTGETIDRTTLYIDMTKGDEKIATEAKDKGSSAQIISNDYGSPQDVNVDSCSYYGNNTWLTCVVVNPEFKETNVYRLENGAWKFVISGSYLSYADFLDLGAPQDLLSKMSEAE